MKTILPNLFFGIISVIVACVIAGGLVGEWWAFAPMIAIGSIAGWKLGSHI